MVVEMIDVNDSCKILLLIVGEIVVFCKLGIAEGWDEGCWEGCAGV